MSRQIEDRLRAAIDAKAATVTKDHQPPWLPPVAAGGGVFSRRAVIWLAPLATAAVVLIVVLVTGLVSPHWRGSAPPEPVVPATHSAEPTQGARPSPSVSSEPSHSPGVRVTPSTAVATPGSNDSLDPSPSDASPTSAGPSSTGPTSAGPSSPATVTDLDLRSVTWPEATIPGATCFSAAPLKLTAGQATVPASPIPHQVSLLAGFEPSSLAYGPVEGAGTTDAAVLTECGNPAMNGDAWLLDSIVVFSGRGGTLHVLGVLHPVNQDADAQVSRFQDVSAGDGQVTATEIFFGPHDPNSDPTGRATTVFTYSGGTFTAHSTITQQPS